MTIAMTNDYGIPDVFVRAAENDSYSMGDADFSVTGLIQPPQISRLRKEHRDDISSDVRDEIWKLLGSGVHAILEQNNSGTVEKRFFATHPFGVRISGAIDLLEDDGAVTDYKVTSVYTTTKGLKPDWEAQLNLYAWLLKQNDIEATSLTIVAVCRDWSKPRSKSLGYPDSPVVSIPVPLWLPEKQDEFMNERVAIHTAEDTAPCTSAERWTRGGYKAVASTGKIKEFDSLQDAAAWINTKKSGSYRVVNQDPKYIRCESWCDVSAFCPQWNEKGEERK
jgi:hypothetical protein